MRRSIVAAVTAAILTVLTSPLPALADTPDHVRDISRHRPDARVPLVGPDSFPGADGAIVYTRSPAASWPGSIWTDDLGGGIVQLTSPTVGQGDSSPSWSPGGTLLVFSRDQTSSTTDVSGDIYLMGSTGTNVRRITNTTAADIAPSFSPDGARIVFSSNRAGNFEIYSMKLDGSDLRRLTNNGADDGQPSWSPDGSRIAFRSNRAGNYEIYSMYRDGSGVTRLTTNAAADFAPNWSPDGGRISFTTERTGNLEIFVMNANGTSPANVSNGPYADFYSSWSPDGSMIVYSTDRYVDWDVVVSDPDGTFLGGIDYTLDDEWNPDWQPVPSFPLVDAQFSVFEGDIIWLYYSGITSGCTPERFCPNDFVTREQMAAFLDRALSLPATSNDYFTDDEGSTFEASINRLAAAGVTSGCGADLFCPKDLVKRDQMASFLARAYALPTTQMDYFTDDEGNTHESNINRIRAAGITTGCTATTYCPSGYVTRGQMAAFLHRADGL